MTQYQPHLLISKFSEAMWESDTMLLLTEIFSKDAHFRLYSNENGETIGTKISDISNSNDGIYHFIELTWKFGIVPDRRKTILLKESVELDLENSSDQIKVYKSFISYIQDHMEMSNLSIINPYKIDCQSTIKIKKEESLWKIFDFDCHRLSKELFKK